MRLSIVHGNCIMSGPVASFTGDFELHVIGYPKAASLTGSSMGERTLVWEMWLTRVLAHPRFFLLAAWTKTIFGTPQGISTSPRICSRHLNALQHTTLPCSCAEHHPKSSSTQRGPATSDTHTALAAHQRLAALLGPPEQGTEITESRHSSFSRNKVKHHELIT